MTEVSGDVRAPRISRTAKDVLSGTAGGIAQVFVGQPLDILKVRLQTSPQGTYTGMVDCAKQIVSKEGPLAFYKGTLTPLIGVGACVSVQFGVVEGLKRYFSGLNARKAGAVTTPVGGDPPLSTLQLYTAGAAAGVANSFIAGPVEQVRIRLQTQQTKIYAGPLDCARQIIGKSGFTGMFRGQIPTMLREGQGMGVYFLTYEALVGASLAQSGLSRKELPTTHAMLAGASAGITLWLSAYPFDVVKSRLQTDAIAPSERKFKGPLDCTIKIFRADGLRGFIRGLAPTLVRAPFANGATFVAFEWAKRNLDPL